jgi:hypothetical protein
MSHTDDLLPFDEIKKIVFSKQKIQVPSNIRFFRKLAQILLVIQSSPRSKSASVLKIQFFNWVFLADENMRILSEYLTGSSLQKPFIPLDPFVNRAIEFGLADKLLEKKNAKIALTYRGIQMYNSIMDDKEILLDEKSFISSMGAKGISEKFIQDLMRSI